MVKVDQGFTEVEHTADWELEVWAPDIPSLLKRAAQGMYWLAGVEINKKIRKSRIFEILSDNPENLLVSFLSELLYFVERDNLCFENIDLELDGMKLIVKGTCNPIISLQKEIKAVTYHNLKIQVEPEGLRVRIVFDV